jgi:hypothetical protein
MIITVTPGDPDHTSITLPSGRVITCAFGSETTVEDFDADILFANGWTTATPQQQTVFGGNNRSTTTFTAIAATALSSGRSVSINPSGQAQQTWGPSPNVDNVVTLMDGLSLSNWQEAYQATALILSSSLAVAFYSAAGSLDPNGGAQPLSIDLDTEVITPGPRDTQTPSVDAAVNFTPLTIISANLGTVGAPTGVAMTDKTFVLAFNDSTNSSNFSVACGTVNNDLTINYGDTVQVASQSLQGAEQVNIVKLPGVAAFAMSYWLADTSSWIVIGTVSGTMITLGTPLSTDNLYQMDPLTATALIGCASTGSTIEVAVISVSGTTPTVGTPAVVTPAGVQQPRVAAMSAGSFVMTNSANLSQIWAGTVSGDVADVGDPITIGPTTAGGFISGPFRFTETLAIIGTQFSGSQIIVEVDGLDVDVASGPTALLGLPSSFAVSGNPEGGGATPYATNAPAVLTDALFLFVDNNMTIYESDASGNLSKGVVHPGFKGYWLYPLNAEHALATFVNSIGLMQTRIIGGNAIAADGPAGFVSQDYDEGSTATIQTSGVVSDLTDQAGNTLAPGKPYYHNGDGSITAGNTGHRAGTALSPTSLLASA